MEMRFWRGRGLIGLFLTMMVSLGHAETIRLVAYDEPPYMVLNSQGRPGVAIEIADALFKRKKIDYELVWLPPRRAYTQATHRENTCVLAIERSQEREASLRWIGPFLITRHAFYRLAASDHRLTTLADIRDYRVGAMLGSGATEYLEGLGFVVDHVAENGLNLGKLELDRIDFWASDTLAAASILSKTNTPVVREQVFLTTLREMACHPKTPQALLKALQAGLDELYQDGTIRNIYKQYPDREIHRFNGD